MRIVYDPAADAAMIYLVPIRPGDVVSTVTYDDVEGQENAGLVNLEFSADGRLLAIDVLAASRILPPATLATAEKVEPDDSAPPVSAPWLFQSDED